jgi:hypothetical protein
VAAGEPAVALLLSLLVLRLAEGAIVVAAIASK